MPGDKANQLSREMLTFHRIYQEKVNKRIKLAHEDLLTRSQFFLLAMIWEQKSMAVKEIVERSCMQKQQVNDLLNQLEGKGLIERKRLTENRREVLVSPTEKTAEIKKTLTETVEKQLNTIFATLEEGMADEYISALQTINRLLEKLP